jgi:hypothetical protein
VSYNYPTEDPIGTVRRAKFNGRVYVKTTANDWPWKDIASTADAVLLGLELHGNTGLFSGGSEVIGYVPGFEPEPAKSDEIQVGDRIRGESPYGGQREGIVTELPTTHFSNVADFVSGNREVPTYRTTGGHILPETAEQARRVAQSSVCRDEYHEQADGSWVYLDVDTGDAVLPVASDLPGSRQLLDKPALDLVPGENYADALDQAA